MGDLIHIISEHNIIRTELIYEYTIVLYLYKNFELKRGVGLEYVHHMFIIRIIQYKRTQREMPHCTFIGLAAVGNYQKLVSILTMSL